MQITLSRKLFIYSSLLLLTVLLSTFVVLERNQAQQWRDYLQIQQLAFARFATPELLKHFRGNFNQTSGASHRQQLKGLLSFNPDLIAFRIFSPTGRELFQWAAAEAVELPDPPFSVERYADVQAPVIEQLATASGQNLLEVVAPAFGPSGQKVLYVRYLFSFQSVELKLQEMRQTFLRIALLASACSLLLVALVAKRFTRPIYRLIEGVREISSGRLETSIATSGSDELATLGRMFNEMAVSLSQNQQELQHKNRQLQQANADLQLYQEQMLRTERLAVVGQVAAGVSHEIDNPVGIILGYAELLLEECDDAERAADLQAIIDECHRCKKITGGLLSLARTGEPRREPIDLGLLVRETVASLQPQKLFRKIAFHLPGEASAVSAWGDADQIRQVLMNLLLNAAQALQGNGQIWIELQQERGAATILVEDDGPGFVDCELEKVFEPFYTTKSGKGTGLGLSICRKLVEEHGGQLSAAASAKGGARFRVDLPLRDRDDS